MHDTLLIVALIAGFAVIQSVFGMGLLIFGTPTLLLMGVSYPETLGWLLPASVAISALQTRTAATQFKEIWRSGRPLLCLAPMLGALVLVLRLGLHAKLEIPVGLALIVAAALRLHAGLRTWLRGIIRRAEPVYLALMGLLHGFTNMGGALLSVYASSQGEGKERTRGVISTYYLSFGVVQLATLAIFSPGALAVHSLTAALVAIAAYVIAGRKVFNGATPTLYERSLTGFIAAYGVAALIKAAL